MELILHPYTPQFEEHRWYLCCFTLNDIQAYFAAFCAGGRWQTACGTDLTDDGWELVAISDELPLLQPGPVKATGNGLRVLQ